MDRVDKVFYINLEARTDRRSEIENELKTQFGYDRAERFVGITALDCGFTEGGGIYGCTMSHIYLFRKMIENGWDTMMVFEDDVQLLTSRNSIDAHINSFLDDPKCDILCIGNSCGDNSHYNQHLKRCYNTQTTSCYVVKKQFIKTLLDCYFKDPSESMTYKEEGLREHGPTINHHIGWIDTGWSELQKTHYFMMPQERQLLQRPSFSNIMNKHVSYGL
jgi:GR25 family glycosyltransferase involved in LPS biosynthesis